KFVHIRAQRVAPVSAGPSQYEEQTMTTFRLFASATTPPHRRGPGTPRRSLASRGGKGGPAGAKGLPLLNSLATLRACESFDVCTVYVAAIMRLSPYAAMMSDVRRTLV